ncbi:MAG TPA: class I SAM-dependent methyltransferase [Acetobacteraceae bacterium]|nr:class I SAM-dependent methyltransferase [Acetobacteraceae bacterium]
MSGWGGGYVTDVTYVTGWYREQSPLIMVLGCLLGGVVAPMPGPDDAVSYLELGCGHGFGAMALAASNPAWRVTAIDFNPAHIATARERAAEAGLSNIAFIEADLATLAGDADARAIPMADFVSLHGVWSWVPAAVRAGIVRLLRDKVRPGGAVHVSYNALPAWGNALGFQRLLRAVGRQRAGRSDRQAGEGLKFIHELYAAEALQLGRSYIVRTLMGRLDALPLTYLTHEYMNESWSPCFMADVAEAMADAKLDWAGSASLVENFAELTLTEPQRALARQYDDPLLRELVKDHCLERMLRHDVYVRGARSLGPRQRDAALAALSIGLNIPPQDLPLEADFPAGKGELNPKFYQPVARALADGPRRVGELLQLPDIEGRRNNPAELVGILVGAALADPVLRPSAPPSPAASRFNAMAARWLMQIEPPDRPMAAASHRAGTPVPASVLDLVVLERSMASEGDMEALVRHVMGIAKVTDEAKLREALASSIDTRLARLRAAGVL